MRKIQTSLNVQFNAFVPHNEKLQWNITIIMLYTYAIRITGGVGGPPYERWSYRNWQFYAVW